MKIGIVGAMEDELGAVKGLMTDTAVTQYKVWEVIRGQISGHEVVLTRCDIGKVNGAIATQMLIDCFDVNVIFNLGSSGAVDSKLEVGDLVIATDAVQIDVDLTDWGAPLGGVMFDALLGENGLTYRSQVGFEMAADLVALAQQASEKMVWEAVEGVIPRVYHGRLLSSDRFTNDQEQVKWLAQTFGGMCVDMEAAAIAHTCIRNQVPCLIIRTISDKADGSAAESFSTFLVAATENYGRLMREFFQALS